MSRLVPAILSVSLFMESADATIIATALPTMAADLGTSPIALKLAMTAYFVALAVVIPISGRLADRVGAKEVFRAAILVFLLGSLACAQAQSLPQMVAARFLQGAGGAMMTPVARLLLVRSADKSELVSAMAWFAVPAMVGPLIGPPLGGAISTWADWRWIFYVNIPIGLIGLALATRFLPHIPRCAVRFDPRGFALSGAACAGLVFGASVISLPALPFWFGAALMALGLAAALAYLRHARRHPAPVLRLRLLRLPSLRASMESGFFLRLGIGATPFLLPMMLQLGFGFTPFVSGLVSASGVLGAMAMKFLARPILRRFGFRATLIAASLGSGLSLMPIGLWRPELSVLPLAALLICGALARSLFFTGVNALAFAELPASRSGDATAMLAAGQQVSIALGVALAGSLLEGLGRLRGADPLALEHFAIAFAVVGALVGFAATRFLRLDPETGAEISGRRANAGQ